eukprot:CAMPEP_0185585314 /NCGR_PEP_ID=MMETSP0434-20130131/37960_1 /TAXON_ID=626734 ORGANISM="Favella taraikaensis, Strain Fe Narragansett Bay" /NCGR_SAMPLE_ID=MMETSP0434 /ASSEMBLY_ACC=CAM_ASM_000379 /LENGTH=144 /DNA_ID=CAMNT_0028205577 /DNA_START=1551 /DNA_END=1986 /DNA_ORIENTATION=-
MTPSSCRGMSGAVAAGARLERLLFPVRFPLKGLAHGEARVLEASESARHILTWTWGLRVHLRELIALVCPEAVLGGRSLHVGRVRRVDTRAWLASRFFAAIEGSARARAELHRWNALLLLRVVSSWPRSEVCVLEFQVLQLASH